MGAHDGPRPRWRSRRLPLLLSATAVAAVLALGGLALGGWVLLGGSLHGDDVGAAADTVPSTSAGPSTPPPTVAPTPTAPVPQVGDCRELGWHASGQPVTDAGWEPGPCGRDHTAQTFATGRLDDTTGLDPIADPDRLLAAVSARCRTALVGWLGGDENDYELSMFAYVVAVPSADDLAAGARWWRCDTFATDHDGDLSSLPRSSKGLLGGDRSGRWATCVRGRLGPGQQQVRCIQRHDWRAISAHRLADRADHFPGRAQLRHQVRSTCQDDVRAYLGDPLAAFDYGWLRPTAADWRAGQRFMLCFAKTPH